MTKRPFLTLCFAVLLGLLLLASQSTARLLDQRGDVFELRKRVDLNTLYNSVPGRNKVPLGGSQHFSLDLTKSATYTTAYFYGCTVVIAVDGGDLIIGHFAQEQAATGSNGQSCIAMTDRTVVQNNIINELVNSGIWVDHTDDTRTWIITSSGTSTVGYSMIRQYFEDNDVLAQNIIPFAYVATSAFTDFSNGPIGKAVVQVVPGSNGGGGTINVYIQSDTPSWSGTYDANGNLVSTAK